MFFLANLGNAAAAELPGFGTGEMKQEDTKWIDRDKRRYSFNCRRFEEAYGDCLPTFIEEDLEDLVTL